MNQPALISVVCLCHNQKPYVHEAIQSVLDQTHPNVELIVIDDGSTDGSKETIKDILNETAVKFIDIEENVGNCKAFNRGLRASSGQYLIDLAADDILIPNRIEAGLETFKSKEIDVEFCNVLNIDRFGNEIGDHFKKNDQVPEGDLYLDLIERYIISPPGMMIKREVFEALDGYDENLIYEDFDFWIRSSRNYKYGYTNDVLVKKRLLPGSHSRNQFRFRTTHQKSTLRVCRKIKKLNRTKEEDLALKRRCFYEIKQCIKQGNFGLVPEFLKLTKSIRISQ